ncbi:ccch-3 [Pristionchus pacificus]|uniref:Ccch-3 n=1 Tax=Pristionchus pacificus TaxID=54126 RepID=A0A2A6CGC6_PRIPA|nr:ccch-3 [Pristionchus pacificus]|eukprot:PDM77113.1 ccch-3 [Pristionchus pacificus]
MSLNLLAGYGSDEDSAEEKDQDEYGEDVEEKEEAEDGNPSTSEDTKEDQKDDGKQKSFFSSDFASSSEDDEEEEEAELAPEVPRLPSARSVLTGTAKLESSLFISEAEKEQDANNAMLSQHVPVSEREKADNRGFRGKRKGQPCRQFLEGRCTRGTRCRFSHVLPETTSAPDPLSATIESKAAFYTDSNEVFNKKAKVNSNDVFSKKAKLN